MDKEYYSTKTLIHSLWVFIKPYKYRFFIASILRALGEITWLYPAYALASIATFFANYNTGESLKPFWYIILPFVIVVIVHSWSIYFANILGFRMAEKAGIDAHLKTIGHLFTLDINWHEKENTGNKVKKIDRGSDAINVLLRIWFTSFIGIGISLSGVLFVIWHFDKTISVLTLVFLVIYFFISVFYTKNAVKVHRAENIKEEELSGLTFESVNNIRSAKVMSMTTPLLSMLGKLSEDLYKLVHKRIFWYQSGGVAKDMTAQLFRLSIISYIGWGIMHGYYEIGFMVLFYGYFSTIQEAVARLAETSQDFAVKKQAVGRMMNLFEIKPITDIENGKVPFPAPWKNIEVKDVSFSYGNKKVLDAISFTISRGEKIGIIGLSGAGKSTLFKLLLKEHEDYTGEIYIDGTPLRSISKSDYFRHAAVVLQETEVFNFSLRNNVTISNADRAHDEALLTKALNIAHVTEFAEKLPEGTETMIGEKGVKLSGGEKQRVGVARAIFKNPELLLLDEATSHLDIESEEKIKDSLHHFFQTVTAIVIAHRLTTIKEMDNILVLEDGKIIEQGNFSELYSQKGRFYNLWEKQKL